MSLLPRSGRLLMLWVATARDAPDEPVEKAAALVRDEMRRSGVGVEDIRAFFVSDGGAPNARQRQVFKETFGGNLQASVVTNALGNPIRRGVATALGWMNPKIRFFDPERVEDAVAHVEMVEEIDAVWSELCTMVAALGACPDPLRVT